MGLVPTYFFTMNTCSVLKLWGRRAEEFFSELSKPLPDDGYAFWELTPTVGNAEYSSLNFLLVSESEEKVADTSIQPTLTKYYVYGFWDLPRQGFACSPSIIYDSYHVSTILKISKTLYVPSKITQRRFRKGNVDIDIDIAELWALGHDGGLTRFEAWLAKDVAVELRAARANAAFPIVNGVVLEFRRRSPEIRPNAFTVVGGYASTRLEIEKCLVAFSGSEIFHRSATLCGIGDIDSLWREVKTASRSLSTKARSAQELDDYNLFEQALTELFPILVTQEQGVGFIHPAVVSVLAGFGILEKCLEDQEMMQSFGTLLDEASDTSVQEILKSPKTRLLGSKGVPSSMVLNALARMVQLISLAKITRGSSANTPNLTEFKKSVLLATCPKCGKVTEVSGMRMRFCSKCGCYIPPGSIFDLGR